MTPLPPPATFEAPKPDLAAGRALLTLSLHTRVKLTYVLVAVCKGHPQAPRHVTYTGNVMWVGASTPEEPFTINWFPSNPASEYADWPDGCVVLDETRWNDRTAHWLTSSRRRAPNQHIGGKEYDGEYFFAAHCPTRTFTFSSRCRWYMALTKVDMVNRSGK